MSNVIWLPPCTLAFVERWKENKRSECVKTTTIAKVPERNLNGVKSLSLMPWLGQGMGGTGTHGL